MALDLSLLLGVVLIALCCALFIYSYKPLCFNVNSKLQPHTNTSLIQDIKILPLTTDSL